MDSAVWIAEQGDPAEPVFTVKSSNSINSEQLSSTIIQPQGIVALSIPQGVLIALSAARKSRVRMLFQRHYVEFALERETTRFYRSSPGLSTLSAELSAGLSHFQPNSVAKLLFSWGRNKTSAAIVSNCGISVGAIALPSQKCYYLLKGDHLLEIGDHTNLVSNTLFWIPGLVEFQGIAIEHWKLIQSAAVELSLIPSRNPPFQNLPVAAGLTFLVSGFQRYMELRYCEMGEEGVKIDAINIEKKFGDSFTRFKTGVNKNGLHAESEGLLHTWLVDDGAVKFGSWDDMKKAFKYCLKFSLSSHLEQSHIEIIKKAVTYRNRLVHISPQMNPLNRHEMLDGKNPDFLTIDLFRQFHTSICEAVERVHAATLEVPRFSI